MHCSTKKQLARGNGTTLPRTTTLYNYRRYDEYPLANKPFISFENINIINFEHAPNLARAPNPKYLRLVYNIIYGLRPVYLPRLYLESMFSTALLPRQVTRLGLVPSLRFSQTAANYLLHQQPFPFTPLRKDI